MLISMSVSQLHHDKENISATITCFWEVNDVMDDLVLLNLSMDLVLIKASL